MAAAELSTSASLVAQELMLIRIAARPFQVVPPHQQVPSSWIAAMTRCVRASSPKATTTWFSTTSLRISAPPALSSPAICRAWRQLRSEEHTSELQSLMRTSYAVFCLKKNIERNTTMEEHKNNDN